MCGSLVLSNPVAYVVCANRLLCDPILYNVVKIFLVHRYSENVFVPCSARYLAKEVNPIFPIIGVLLLFYCVAFLLRTGCIDPGIVPRASQTEANYFIKLSTPGEY